PEYLADDSGKPMHSWRVLILPFIDQHALYADYRFDEPWDGPNNVKLLDRMPRIYACPTWTPGPGPVAAIAMPPALLACEDAAQGPAPTKYTSYAAVVGPNCAFRGAEFVAFSDFKDGPSNTLLIGEVTETYIPWTKPEDVDVTRHPKLGDRRGFSSDHG